MVKIKKIIVSYECPSCGSILNGERDIVIDNYLGKKIEIPSVRCACGRKSGFRPIDIKIEETNKD